MIADKKPPLSPVEYLVLSKSDEKIVKLVADGQKNVQIAEALGVTEGTIKNRISEILKKNNLQNRTELAIRFLKAELVARGYRPTE